MASPRRCPSRSLAMMTACSTSSTSIRRYVPLKPRRPPRRNDRASRWSRRRANAASGSTAGARGDGCSGDGSGGCDTVPMLETQRLAVKERPRGSPRAVQALHRAELAAGWTAIGLFSDRSRATNGRRLQNLPGAEMRLRVPRMLRGIRGRLVMLVAAALFPVLLFAIGGVVALADRERDGIELGLRDTARSLALGVERELDSSVTALRALTTSAQLHAGDRAQFRDQLERVRAEARAPWVTAAAIDASGHVLISLTPQLGAVFPAAADPEFFRPVFASARPWVAHMSLGPTAPQILVAVPVTRQGRADTALVAVLSAQALPSIIWRHRLPAGASVYVLDANNTVVARTASGDGAGVVLQEDGIEDLRREGWEGVAKLVTASGQPIYAAHARSPEWGWTAALVVPASTVDGSWRRWLAGVAGGGVLLLLLGVALALVAARGVALPIAALARSAEALGRGEELRPVRSGVTELDEVGHAIGEAAEARRESARQLQVRAEQQAAIVALGQRALAGSDIVALLDDAARTLCSTLGAELCHVLELDAFGAQLVLRAAMGSASDLVGQPVGPPSPESLHGYALRTGEPVVVGDLTTETRFKAGPFLERNGAVSGVTVMIHGAARPYGPLGVYSSVFRAFTRDDVNVLQGIANILASAMERTHAEAERAELLRRERAARTAAEAASRAKDEFLAMLGHELRNPLAAIANASEALDQGAQTAETQRRLITIVARQARHLSRMVDDLLDVSRVSSGKIVLSREPVDLREVAERAVAAFREAGRITSHQLSMSAECVVVYGDPTRLEQIMGNLLDNALKYTPPGGQVSVAVGRSGRSAVLCVRDTGVGIAPELLPHIFDLFVQARRSIDRAEGGLGLGLALVRRLVELHGGTVIASSAGPGQGSEFTVRLPALATSPGPAAPPTGAAAPSARRVLIVEDNADAREALALWLQGGGHRVEQAADGPAGLEIARADPPDVALIDVGLPGIDGYALARKIRAESRCDGMRLVALTGYSRSSDRERGHEAGFDTYLVKPVDPAELRSVLSDGC